MKKLALILFALAAIPAAGITQTQIDAKDIIQQINEGKPVYYENVEITGDLDFTSVEDVTREGRFSDDRGVVRSRRSR